MVNSATFRECALYDLNIVKVELHKSSNELVHLTPHECLTRTK